MKLFLQFLGLVLATGISRAQTYPVVHTGVSDFYNNSETLIPPSPEEDQYWQDAGRIYNEPSYTDNGDGTVTDNVTGLMWQHDMGGKLTFADALNKADTLTLGDFDDWRIPTIKELYSLILFTGRVKGAEAISFFIDTAYFIQPLGDVSAGEREIDAQTWSSTHYTGLTMRADTTVFGVNFVDGRIKGYPKYKPANGSANKMYFRMVRGNADYGQNNFSHNGNGTVSDLATGLMWQQSDDGTGRDWESSITYCEELELGGFSDWHLPNIKELQSIVDYTRSPMATQSPAIDPVFGVSETNDPEGNPGHYPYFWATTTHLDGPNHYSGAAYVAFGKALGEMNGQLMDVHGAGAQRSDPKTGDPADYPTYQGPQGDARIVFNHCRCVRQINQVSGIKQSETSMFTAHPNPTSGLLQIKHEFPGGQEYGIQIHDQMMRLLRKSAIEGSSCLLDLSDFPAGHYFLLFTSSGQPVEISGIILQ